MFALGLQESCQAVALLLGATDGEKFMKVVIVAVLRPPGLGKVPDHRAYLRLHPVLIVVSAKETDDLPMLIGQHQAFRLRLCAPSVSGALCMPSDQSSRFFR